MLPDDDPADRKRVLDWPACHNARDIGGYPTLDGTLTRWRAIVRSDNPARLTPEGMRAVAAYGIRTVIDLRAPFELDIDPPPFRDHSSSEIVYALVPLLLHHAAPKSPAETLAEEYIEILDQYAERFAAVLQAIAEAPPGGVLVHCHSGKDRTGLVIALLLGLARVPAQTIAADYGLTSVCLKALDDEWLENGPGERIDRERDFARMRARDETMLRVLDHLNRAHGGIERYLLSAGLHPESVARLRGRLLEA